jgi:hypothetical protein
MIQRTSSLMATASSASRLLLRLFIVKADEEWLFFVACNVMKEVVEPISLPY